MNATLNSRRKCLIIEFAFPLTSTGSGQINQMTIASRETGSVHLENERGHSPDNCRDPLPGDKRPARGVWQ
jgi:hypothetical protein